MKLTQIATLALALSCMVANADDGVFRGAGGAVILSQSENVRLVAEEVLLDLTEPEVVHATCLFVVKNDGGVDSLLVGFPDYWPDSDRDRAAGSAPTAIYDLLITEDGIPVATNPVAAKQIGYVGYPSEHGQAYNQAHVWQCSFAPGQTRVLRTEYRHKFSVSTAARYELGYILTTGASWAGSIGQIVVRVQPGKLRLKHAWHPTNWDWTGTEYVWRASNIEPKEEIAVGLDDPQASAVHLKRNWLWHVEHEQDSGAIDVVGYLAELGYYRGCRPDYLQEVCVALGDTLPELRSILEEFKALQ